MLLLLLLTTPAAADVKTSYDDHNNDDADEDDDDDASDEQNIDDASGCDDDGSERASDSGGSSGGMGLSRVMVHASTSVWKEEKTWTNFRFLTVHGAIWRWRGNWIRLKPPGNYYQKSPPTYLSQTHFPAARPHNNKMDTNKTNNNKNTTNPQKR